MDAVLSFGAWWAPVLAIVALARIAGVAVRLNWLTVAMGLQALYFASNVFGGDFIPLQDYFGDLNWNWGGKIASTVTTIIAFVVLAIFTRAITFRSAGFLFRQNPGSVWPALIAITVLTLLVIGLEIAAADGRDIGAERLLFQATMPGIDEEFFFRGLFLAALAAAVPTSGFNFFGAHVTLAGFLMTLLFGLGHGVSFSDGALSISWIIITITGFLGFWLYWIRERTGSILLAILGHNVINFAASFF